MSHTIYEDSKIRIHTHDKDPEQVHIEIKGNTQASIYGYLGKQLDSARQVENAPLKPAIPYTLNVTPFGPTLTFQHPYEASPIPDLGGEAGISTEFAHGELHSVVYGHSGNALADVSHTFNTTEIMEGSQRHTNLTHHLQYHHKYLPSIEGPLNIKADTLSGTIHLGSDNLTSLLDLHELQQLTELLSGNNVSINDSGEEVKLSTSPRQGDEATITLKVYGNTQDIKVNAADAVKQLHEAQTCLLEDTSGISIHGPANLYYDPASKALIMQSGVYHFPISPVDLESISNLKTGESTSLGPVNLNIQIRCEEEEYVIEGTGLLQRYRCSSLYEQLERAVNHVALLRRGYPIMNFPSTPTHLLTEEFKR